MPQPFIDNTNYRAEIRALLALHRLWLDGKGESPEADAVRDATDGHWELLSEVERKRLRGLSEDSNSIEVRRPGQTPIQVNSQTQTRLVDALECRRKGEWDRALDLLRILGNDAPPALISHLRGSIWLEAGDAEVAVVFIEHAARLEPDSSSYHALVLSAGTTLEQPLNANAT